MTTRDRRSRLEQTSGFNGIDFVEVVNATQKVLRVHFVNGLDLAFTLDDPPATITGGESIPTVTVNPVDDARDWGYDGSHLVLLLTVAAPGDFSNYTLTLRQKASLASGSPRLDPFFAQSVFTFKVLCPSDLDCQAAIPACPPPPPDAPPIDYLAKDFLSFRQALLDFSALRYPDWQERSEADFRVHPDPSACAGLAFPADDVRT